MPPGRHQTRAEFGGRGGGPGAGGRSRIHAGPEPVSPVAVAGSGAARGEGMRPAPQRAQVTFPAQRARRRRRCCSGWRGGPAPPDFPFGIDGLRPWARACGGAVRAPSRQVWLGGLSQALIRACPPRGVAEGGNGSEPDSFLGRETGRRGPFWPGAEKLASRPPARGPLWQHVAPGRRGLGGSGGVAVAGPRRRPNVLCTKTFAGRPGRDGLGACRGEVFSQVS